MYLLLAFTCQSDSNLVPFHTINNISTLVNKSNFTFVFFKAACHANTGAVRKQAGLSSYISRHIFQKFSNTSASNNGLL